MSLLDPGNDLPPNRAQFVRGINQVEEVRRDGQRQLVVGKCRPGVLLGAQAGHQPLQLLHRRDPVLQLPVPVIPVRVGNVPPIATPCRPKFSKLRVEVCWRRLLVLAPLWFNVHFQFYISYGTIGLFKTVSRRRAAARTEVPYPTHCKVSVCVFGQNLPLGRQREATRLAGRPRPAPAHNVRAMAWVRQAGFVQTPHKFGVTFVPLFAKLLVWA